MGVSWINTTVSLYSNMPQDLFQYIDSLSRYGASHHKHKAVARPSFCFPSKWRFPVPTQWYLCIQACLQALCHYKDCLSRYIFPLYHNHQATSHYLNQCWPRSPMPYGVIRPKWVNEVMYQGLTYYTTCMNVWIWFFMILLEKFSMSNISYCTEVNIYMNTKNNV